jgi:hypothetical protein
MDLQKRYHLLTRRERLALYLSACGREDDEERAAVLTASPYIAMKVVDFFGEIDALRTFSLLHIIAQLELCLKVSARAQAGATDEDTRLSEVRYLAGCFVVAEEAFQSLAKDYGLATEQLYHSPVSPMLGRIYDLGSMEALAAIANDLAADLAALAGDGENADALPALPTVEEKRREYQAALVELISHGAPQRVRP